MTTINFEPNFDPNTWCKDYTDNTLSQKPIKKIVCFLLDLIDVLSPLTAFTATLFESIYNIISENKETFGILVILLPSIPLLMLLNYFFDNL